MFIDDSESCETSHNDPFKQLKKRGPKKKACVKRTKPISFMIDKDFYDLCSDSDTSDDVQNNEKDKESKKDELNQLKYKMDSTLNKPWIEKYRPTNVNDLVLDENTASKLKKIILDKNMPNIIITGHSGIGKTSTILCIAKNLLGKNFKNGILEMNASDERGVKSVQDSIEYFCKKKWDVDASCCKHKIVLLDEADNMTKQAQKAINVLMEKYYDTTRFAFTCNNSTEIIEAIQSRCLIFKYHHLAGKQVTDKLTKICETESIPYTAEGIESIVMTAQGDLRQAINNLQLTFNGYNNIVPENVYKLCDKPQPLLIKNIFIACEKKNAKRALSILNELYDKGYSSSDISTGMLYTLKTMDTRQINDKKRMEYLIEISNVALVISQGINTRLQLNGAIASLCI